LGSQQSIPKNRLTVASAVLVQLTRCDHRTDLKTDRHTNHAMCDIYSNRPYLYAQRTDET